MLTGPYLILIVATLALFGSLQMLMGVMPQYIVSLGAGQRWVGTVVGFFPLAALVTRPFVGRLTVTWGRGAVLRLGALVFMLAPLLYIVCQNVFQFSLARVWHGIGFSLFTTASLTLAADLSPEERRGEALALVQMSSRLAFAVAPAAGTALLATVGYSPVFVISAVLASVALWSGLLLKPPPAQNLRTAGGGYRETLRRRTMIASLIVLTPSSIAFGVLMSYAAFLSPARGMADSGPLFSGFAISLIIGLGIGGKVMDRYGPRWLVVSGLALMGLGFVGLARLWGATALVAAVGVFGLGHGLGMVAANTLAAAGTTWDDRGHAMAVYTGYLDLGIMLGPSGLGYLLGEDVPCLFLVTSTLYLPGLLLYLLWESR